MDVRDLSEGKLSQQAGRLPDSARSIEGASSNHPDRAQQSAIQVAQGNLPGLELGSNPLAQSAEVLSRLQTMSQSEQLTYAKELCRSSFTNNPRFQAAFETSPEGAGDSSREKLVDLDLVETTPDGRVKRIDLLNTTRGASERADYVQKVNDAVSPAVKAFEELRSKFQKGNLVSDGSESPLSPPTKVSGNEVGLSLEFAEQIKKELNARGFSTEFVKDALAAFRKESGQQLLEDAVLDKEISELKAKSNKSADDKQSLKDMEAYKKENSKAQEDWKLKQKDLKFGF